MVAEFIVLCGAAIEFSPEELKHLSENLRIIGKHNSAHPCKVCVQRMFEED